MIHPYNGIQHTAAKNNVYIHLYTVTPKRCLTLLTRERSKLLNSIGISPFSLKFLRFASLKCAHNTQRMEGYVPRYLLWLFLSRKGYKCFF